MDVTVTVATYGEDSWRRLAVQRAVPSARLLHIPVIHVHGDTLHGSRNAALAQVETEWVINLDGDDELEPGYIDAMDTGTADVRAPAVRYVRNNRPRGPAAVPHVWGHDHHACVGHCLPEGNWLVIGACVRTDLLRETGGWHDYAWSEDWATWLRCHYAGATFEAIPSAVYRAHTRSGSRNRGQLQSVRLESHERIYADCLAWKQRREGTGS